MARTNISSGGPYEEQYGYSRAVRIGNTVHVAGTCAQPPNVEDHDAYEQAIAALWIIRKALHDVGAGIDDVVRTRTFVVDMADADKVMRAHGEVFEKVRPAATLLGVGELIDPALLVEIEVDAVVGD